ncbi:MAG: hypothetical protein QOE82_3331 [Thermoanaerobaculia bacterium]|nr:hypothetical protein [Thermoanaerobaculia bacterium]
MLFLLLAVFGCASGGPGTSLRVTISQVSRVEPLRIAALPLDPSVAHGVPVDYEIKVTNPFDHAVSLTSLEVETVGSSGAYSMKRVRHAFSLAINPRSDAVVPIRAWVQPLQDTDTGDVNGPVTVRGIATFTTDAGPMTSRFAARVQ